MAQIFLIIGLFVSNGALRGLIHAKLIFSFSLFRVDLHSMWGTVCRDNIVVFVHIHVSVYIFLRIFFISI